MEILFLACAIFGGTVLLAQFLLGFGGHHLGSAEFHEDAADSSGDDQHDAGDADGDDENGHHHGSQTHQGSTWMFGILTFRTAMIGLTFFGLTGKAALASGFEQPMPLVVAVGCALAAMYGVYFLMRGLYRLTADGTERIGRSVGHEAIVYLPIPAHNEGAGKVHVTLQNRLVEVEATTSGERLLTGARVVVVGVSGSDRVMVESIPEAARSTHV